jgi:cell division protein FtsB
MTFIQPNNKKGSSLNKILAILVCLLFFGSVWLIVIYNNIVNFNHGISQMKEETEQIRAKNVEIENKILNLVSDASLKNKTGAGLVQDKNPQYFKVNQQWSYVSGL